MFEGEKQFCGFFDDPGTVITQKSHLFSEQ